MALSALTSVQAAEKEAAELIANARKEAAQLQREAAEQAKEVIAAKQKAATAKAEKLRAESRGQSEAEAAEIRAQATASIDRFKTISTSKKAEVLSFVAEGVVKRYVDSGYVQNQNISTQKTTE